MGEYNGGFGLQAYIPDNQTITLIFTKELATLTLLSTQISQKLRFYLDRPKTSKTRPPSQNSTHKLKDTIRVSLSFVVVIRKHFLEEEPLPHQSAELMTNVTARRDKRVLLCPH